MAFRYELTDPQVRCSPGSFVGYEFRRSAFTFAALLKRASVGAWQGILTMDTGSAAIYHDWFEFNPSNQLALWNGGAGASDISGNGTTALASITEWEIVSIEFDPATPGAAATPVLRWKVGAAAWASQTLASDSAADATAVGSGYRWVIGNEPGLGDDARYDLVCAGAYKDGLGQTAIESLTMTDFASWAAVFTGPNAWLIGHEDAGTQLDRTGNGGDEVSRNNVSLVGDPPGWSWATAAAAAVYAPPIRIPNPHVGPVALRHQFHRSYWPTGISTQTVPQAVTATVTTTATIARQVGKAVTANATATASIVRSVGKAVTGNVSSTATMIRQAGKRVTATVTTTATMQAIKAVLLTLTATVTTTATMSRQAGKTLAATVTATASIRRQVGKVMSATVTATATVTKTVAHALVATVTATASLVAQFVSGSAVIITRAFGRGGVADTTGVNPRESDFDAPEPGGET